MITELHPTRNPDVDPTKLAWATNRRVWWRYPEVATLRKDLLAIWDEDLNAGLDAASVAVHSSQRVWWRCLACDRRWQATVNNRSRAGHYLCPRCARREVAPATTPSFTAA
ncbi:MAG: zinc-ribbon domain-containing protein [Solirubrobacterales bacterium]|nr:zinc-ribbon domain-containing protein [Solirubrobacterales bacterium]